jgi:hypothetical protein
MKATIWIERVEYPVKVLKLPGGVTVKLPPAMATGSTAPTPVFAITTPAGGVKALEDFKVLGTQI